MVMTLNEDTVDAYTAMLNEWAYGLVEKMENIPKLYAEITYKVAEIDAKLVSVGYGPEAQALNVEKDELLYGQFHRFSAKEFTELDKLSVKARYFPQTFLAVLKQFGETGGLFAVNLRNDGLIDSFTNQLDNLGEIAKKIDEEKISKYLEKNKDILKLEGSMGLPMFGFDPAKYESLLAQKMQVKQ
ncbi:MAG: hypothetical protein KAS90_03340 [Candidatus Aenigmarchaeota archaeon]|nr:hypothetical protein [Candidatus Aenigmarchaeota archaeon]